MDDVIETLMMNILFNGEICTMRPYQEMFRGEMAIIRPWHISKNVNWSGLPGDLISR